MKKGVLFLLKELGIATDELSLYFVTERHICKIHEEFFNDPSLTDCMTFPLDPPGQQVDPHILGEAFICPKTALKVAKRLGQCPQKELYRYVIHCLLHLIGYTDATPKERSKMKRKERECLKKLYEKCFESLK
jgi:probable rRNA maturation factor